MKCLVSLKEMPPSLSEKKAKGWSSKKVTSSCSPQVLVTMKVESSDDFEGVGGDPGGMYYNSRTWDPEERNQAVSEVGHVPIPETDPVFGNTDPMLDKWKK